MRRVVSIDELKKLLRYDPETGEFFWLERIRKDGRRLPSKKAGCITKIVNSKQYYLQIRLLNVLYNAHQLAWFYMTGEWPSQIDHEDLNGLNNKWENLRLATQQNNSQNRLRRIDTPNEVPGVYYIVERGAKAGKKHWQAQIGMNGRMKRIGRYATKEEAIVARIAAEKRLFGPYAPRR